MYYVIWLKSLCGLCKGCMNKHLDGFVTITGLAS
jgi:hypothetical protein